MILTNSPTSETPTAPPRSQWLYPPAEISWQWNWRHWQHLSFLRNTWCQWLLWQVKCRTVSRCSRSFRPLVHPETATILCSHETSRVTFLRYGRNSYRQCWSETTFYDISTFISTCHPGASILQIIPFSLRWSRDQVDGSLYVSDHTSYPGLRDIPDRPQPTVRTLLEQEYLLAVYEGRFQIGYPEHSFVTRKIHIDIFGPPTVALLLVHHSVVVTW